MSNTAEPATELSDKRATLLTFLGLTLFILCGLILLAAKQYLPANTGIYATTGEPTGLFWAAVAVAALAITNFTVLRLTKTDGLIGMFLQIMSIVVLVIVSAGLLAPVWL